MQASAQENLTNWLGNSKVVDGDGIPLIVYHGSTTAGLEVINPGHREPGAWFTSSIGYANDYAKGADGEIYSVYLKIEKPMVATFNGNMEPVVDGVVILDKYDEPIDNNIDIIKHAMANRHDGVIFPDGNFSEESAAWVVFSSGQIKSATANNGEYSAETNSILK